MTSMPEHPYLFHIATNDDVANYQQTGEYSCASLNSEGFIHCCDAHQLSGVVTRYYSGVDDVQLISIDPDKLDAALIRENTVGGSELFPHVYGPINQQAIMNIEPFGIQSLQRVGLFE